MIVLKSITLGDLEWARELRNSNSDYFFDSERISVSQQEQWFKYYEVKKNYNFFIIVRDGVRVGTISVHDKKKYREIGNVIIAEPFRGEGVFKEVMNVVESKFEKPFMLEVLSSNIHAFEIYKSMGFVNHSISLIKL